MNWFTVIDLEERKRESERLKESPSRGVVIEREVDDVEKKIKQFMSDNKIRLTPKEVDEVIDSYIRLYMFRIDPVALVTLVETVK